MMQNLLNLLNKLKKLQDTKLGKKTLRMKSKELKTQMKITRKESSKY